jgi:hypothetical protein
MGDSQALHTKKTCSLTIRMEIMRAWTEDKFSQFVCNAMRWVQPRLIFLHTKRIISVSKNMDKYITLNYVMKRQVTSREQEICRNCLNVKDRKEVSWTGGMIN